VKLLVATRSAGKQKEVLALFADTGIDVVFPNQAGIPESPAESALELHDSFRGNALAKAEYFSRKSGGLPTVADDSGLEVFSLGGEPGVRSKRWGGKEGPDEVVSAANNEYLLQRLLGAEGTRRKARYRCILAFLKSPHALPEFYEGACTGEILAAPVGSNGFGYDPLFRSDDLGKSFGEASAAEKDRVSHRGRAFDALKAALGVGQGPPPRDG
jgi:XTP/dITP diphosphohydrolase